MRWNFIGRGSAARHPASEPSPSHCFAMGPSLSHPNLGKGQSPLQTRVVEGLKSAITKIFPSPPILMGGEAVSAGGCPRERERGSSIRVRGATIAVIAVAMCALSTAALADSYPSRPIRVVVTAAAGGTTDFLARWIGKGFTDQTGTPVIVENRGGAGGNVGGELVAKSPPDGYTLAMVASGAIIINPWLYASMPYDPLTDLVPVFNVANAPQFLIIPSSVPARTLKEFIDLAKANPGQFNYGSAGNGSTTHLALDHFARLAGIKLVHIPYRGIGAAVADLVAGRVQMLSTSIPPVRVQLESGEVRALCLAAPQRLSVMPDVPTAAEAGLPGYDMTTWFGFLAPKGTDPAVVDFLNAHFQKTLDDPETRRRFEELGVEPNGGPASSFAATIKKDAKYWEPIVKAAGIKPE